MNIKNLIVASILAIATTVAPVATFGADLSISQPVIDTTIYSQIVNFDGPYAGLGVINSNGTNVAVASVGYDVRYDAFIAGVEAFGTLDNAPVLGIDIKAGVAVTEDLALYGIVGYQKNTGTDVDSNAFGVGADLAITDNIYVTGSYKQVYDFGTFNNRDDQFRIGVKLAF